MVAAVVDLGAGLVDHAAVDGDLSGQDGRASLGACGEEAAVDEQHVQPLAHPAAYLTRVSAGLCARAASATACGVSPMSASTRVRSPCATKASGSPKRTTSTALPTASRTALPKPPARAFSSTVTRRRCAGGEPLQQLRVQRLHEARVDDGRRDALRGEQLGRLAGDADPGADADERHVGALLEHHAAAHLERLDLLERRERRGEPARVAQRRGSVEREGRREHALQLLLAGRRHHRHARDHAQEGQVEGAVMRRAVVADEAGPVHGERHRQVLQPDVLDEHVEGALQEGRVEGDDRPHAADGEAGGEDGRVLLGDADVVEPVGEAPLEGLEAGPLRHGRGDRHDALVLLREPHERLAERVGVAGRRPPRPCARRSRCGTGRCRGRRPAGPRRARSPCP